MTAENERPKCGKCQTPMRRASTVYGMGWQLDCACKDGGPALPLPSSKTESRDMLIAALQELAGKLTDSSIYEAGISHASVYATVVREAIEVLSATPETKAERPPTLSPGLMLEHARLDAMWQELVRENTALQHRAAEAEHILTDNMALANRTTRRAMNERNEIIKKLRERYSAIEIADMAGLTRQRVHQILNEAPDESPEKTKEPLIDPAKRDKSRAH